MNAFGSEPAATTAGDSATPLHGAIVRRLGRDRFVCGARTRCGFGRGSPGKSLGLRWGRCRVSTCSSLGHGSILTRTFNKPCLGGRRRLWMRWSQYGVGLLLVMLVMRRRVTTVGRILHRNGHSLCSYPAPWGIAGRGCWGGKAPRSRQGRFRQDSPPMRQIGEEEINAPCQVAV